jgi:septal ring factor EnvC (AmiA/AmiB activator)
MSLEQEIEATRKLSQEIAEKSERLAQEALDPSKQLAPLFAIFDQEAQRLDGLNKQQTTVENSLACVAAAATVIADWAVMEAMVVEDATGGKPASPAGERAAPRRGMRV